MAPGVRGTRAPERLHVTIRDYHMGWCDTVTVTPGCPQLSSTVSMFVHAPTPGHRDLTVKHLSFEYDHDHDRIILLSPGVCVDADRQWHKPKRTAVVIDALILNYGLLVCRSTTGEGLLTADRRESRGMLLNLTGTPFAVDFLGFLGIASPSLCPYDRYHLSSP